MSPFEALVRDLLSSGCSVRFRAAGDSMHPAIRNGEVVEVTPCDSSLLRRGDVVLALAVRGLTLHRIAQASREGIVMRGDNAPCRDGVILHENILGIVREKGKRSKRWRSAAKSVKIIRFVADLVRRFRGIVRIRLQHSSIL